MRALLPEDPQHVRVTAELGCLPLTYFEEAVLSFPSPARCRRASDLPATDEPGDHQPRR